MWTRATPGADLGFFSGFVAGDGSFYIRPNNGGSVDLWAAAGGASPVLARYAHRLGALHKSAVPVPCPVDIRPVQLLQFLAGFASAEAHFGTTREGWPAFVINVRADDGPLLQRFRDLLGVGTLRDVAPAGGSKAAVSWRVSRLADMRVLVAALDSAPPRGRAGKVYAVWRELVLLDRRTGAARAALAAEIRRRRAYRPELSAFPATTGRDRSRQRCLGALKSWVESRETPGSAVDYANWRRTVEPRPPTRNTVARVFGSWSAALEAAGISRERAMSAERVAAIRAGGAARREARHAELRDLVVAAVRRCSAELGREPRASEFLRWRHQHSPDCPSQMTIYRVFPGGFREVLAAARD